MAYIGQRPVVGRYIKLDQISSGFNGSNTDFNMTAGSQAVFPGTARNLLLSLGGVIQEPDTDFTISGSTLTFTTPPVSNTTFFGVIYGDMQSTGTPSDGTVLPASIASSGNFSFPEITLTGDLTIPDKLIHSGDTDTAIRFPSNNTVSFETGGSEAVRIHSNGYLLVGTTSSRNVGGRNANLQIQGTGGPQSALSITRNTANVNGPHLDFGKSRAASLTDNTVVQDGDSLGNITFNGADGTDTVSEAAQIKAEVDGTPGSNDMPGRLVFKTTPDGTVTSSERLRITSGGNLLVNNTTGRGVGNTNTRLLQLEGTGGESGIAVVRNGNNTSGAALSLGKSRTNSVEGTTIVNTDDKLGVVSFCGADGTDLISIGAQITGEVDGTPGSNDMPGRLVFKTTSDGSSTTSERMRITSDGKVGISTTAPQVTLDIGGASSGGLNGLTNSVLYAGFTNNTNFGGVVLGAGSNGNTPFIAASKKSDGTALPLDIITNGSNKVRLDTDGKVGIGTTSPDQTLHVHKATAGSIASDTNAVITLENNNHCILQMLSPNSVSNRIMFGDPQDANIGELTYDHSIDALVIKTAVNERLRITSAGLVGIGTSSPTGRIHLQDGSANNDAHVTLHASATTGTNNNGEVLKVISSRGTGNQNPIFNVLTNTSTSVFNVMGDGNIRVGSTGTSSTRLHITAAGTSSTTGDNAIRINDGSSTHLFLIREDGLFQTGNGNSSPYNLTGSTGANVFIHANSKSLRRSTSSVKYKKDIADATWGLAEVLKLRPVTFKSNGTGDMTDDQTYGGFTAEDIHDLGLTEFVQYNENNQPDALSYGNMVALLTNAIKELATKVAALEAA